MALIFCEGFDKYGSFPYTQGPTLTTLLNAEWTTVTLAGTSAIVSGLSVPGFAFLLTTAATLTKTLLSNYARLIGGLRFNVNAFGTAATQLMQFRDGVTAQCTITMETSGIINLRSGGTAGTILAGGGSIATNSTHYLEWDITFGTSAAYQLWLDGVSLVSGTGNTRAGTTNNYANSIAIASAGTAGTVSLDDLYLFDTSGSVNNAVLLTSPRIETTFPVSDSAAQFGFGAGILGSTTIRVGTPQAPLANSLVLRRFTPPVACTLNSIGIVTGTSSGTANYRGVVYGDSAGSAGTLMSSGSTVTGVTSGALTTLPLTTPQSLAAGTPYWLGFMNDTSISNQLSDTAAQASRAAATFTSGAPGTAPAMTSGQPTYVIWGNLTGITGNNWYEASQNPAQGAQSYVFDTTVAHEDLYNFAALSAIPATVYGVAVKGYCSKSDSGAKTLSLRMKSGATDSGGSLTGQGPATTYAWMTSTFETDPATSAAWTGSALNAATSGVRVDS